MSRGFGMDEIGLLNCQPICVSAGCCQMLVAILVDKCRHLHDFFSARRPHQTLHVSTWNQPGMGTSWSRHQLPGFPLGFVSKTIRRWGWLVPIKLVTCGWWLWNWVNPTLPSGKLLHKLWKITIFNGKTHYKWPFSIAMLNYQRVDKSFTWTMNSVFLFHWQDLIEPLLMNCRDHS